MTGASVEVGEGSNTGASVLVALVASLGVLKLLEVGVAVASASLVLNTGGVEGLVGDTSGVTVVVLGAEVIVVGSVVPGTEVVGPAAIAVIGVVLVAVGVGSLVVAEGVTTEADLVTNIAGGVLVTLVADASLLLTVVVVVVTRDGVKGNVDLSRLVAPLVVDGLLGIPMVVGSPLVPGVVNPLVVALTLMARLSVRVVGIGTVLGAVAVSVTVAMGSMALVAVVLVIGAVSLRLIVIRLSVPCFNAGKSCSEKY